VAEISRVVPGQVLYTVQQQKMGNTTMKTTVVHTVVVKEVDPEGRFVIASWNHNAARRFYPSSVKSWKVKKPVLVGSGMSKRLATKAELAAMAAEQKSGGA
jgi:hypothetical protein